jgi:hypothetical protein
VASHTISGQAWANGTTVGVYPAVAVPAGSDVPSGQPVTTAVVSGGSVSFTGLLEKVRYYAYASGVGRSFLISATLKEGDRARIEMLEAEVGSVVSAVSASGDTSGATDTAVINAALARGWAVGEPGSVYYVSSSLIPVSDSTLDMTGCAVRLTAQANMLRNAAVAPVATGTDVATTAGSSVVASATLAAVATVGQQLAVVGAGPAGGDGGGPVWLYGTVLSIAGSTITLTGNINGVAATNTLSGATGYLFNRDRNITIIGGTWDAGTIWNGSWRQTFNSHIMRLRRIDGLKVHGATLKFTGFPIGGGWAFGVNPQDCTDWDVWDITGDGCSNIVQGAGPLYRGTVRDIRGQAQDDMVAFGNVAFQGDDTEGDIIDLEIDGIQANNSLRALKQFGGTGSNGAQRITSGFTFRSVKGTTQTEPVAIIEYAGVTNIDCVGEDITAYAPGGYAQVYIAAQQAQTIDLRALKWPLRAGVPLNGLVKTGRPVQNLKLRELDIRSPAGTALGVLLTDSAGTGVGTYQQVLIDGVSQPDTAPVVQLVKVATARPIDSLLIKGWRMRAASNSILVYKNFSSALSQVDIIDGRADGPNTFFFYNDSADTTNPVTLRIARVYGVATAAGALATVKSPSLILLSDIEWNSSAAGVQVNAGGTPVRIEGSNLRFIGSSQALFTRTGAQVVSVSSLQGTVDLAAITTNAADGDIAYNSNAGLSLGTGLATYRTGGTGNGWKHLYSGTTY